MSKRFGKHFQNDRSIISKKPRLDITKGSEPNRRMSKSRTSTEASDEWGDDFEEAELEELDMIASQACSQEVNTSLQCLDPQPGPSNINKLDFSLTRASSSFTSFDNRKSNNDYLSRLNDLPSKMSQASQILASSNNLRPIAEEEPVIDVFKKNLMIEKKLNSTFQTKNNVVAESDDITSKTSEKLEVEHRKLLNLFTVKEGETIFLRQRLQEIQEKAVKDSMKHAKAMEQQAGEFREKINALHKETESLKTQYELQAFQLNKYAERCKMFESGLIKLNSPTKNTSNISRSRSITFKESNVRIQTELIDPQVYYLKTDYLNYPFKKISYSIFELSLPEKSIVDIQAVNRSGKRNLPILQDERSFRIFENPNIVKPKVTIIDNKNLCIEFFQPDIGRLINESKSEINAKKNIFIINKIVAVTRELLLNLLAVLQAIKLAMNNDDVRDMNDVYFSNFYDIQIEYNQSPFSAKEWHDKERGIEARRALAVLCYIVKHSDYLGEYIAGKSELNVQGDIEYERIVKQMIRYNEWPEKGHHFEMLELIQKFVTTFGFVRRAHQFTGLICCICKMLSNVQKTVKFDHRGLIYISNIIKELVYSRPLLQCMISMTEMITEFCECENFVNRLVNNVNKQALHVWKKTLNFTDDACVLKIFLNQLKSFKFDEISTIKTTYALMKFADTSFRSNILPWPSETNNDNECCIELLTLVVKMLYESVAINHKRIEKKMTRKKKDVTNDCDNSSNNYLGKSFLYELKGKQLSCIKMGIRFLNYLTKQDPEFVVRSIDIDTPFFLFIENVTSLNDLKWHEIDKEALMSIKSTFIYDRPPTPDYPSEEANSVFNIKKAFAQKSIPTPLKKKKFEFRKNHNEHREMAEMFSSLLSIKEKNN
ncbi:uncharacterized protein [Chelonus insularis]|uniref:uncharacterized protein n=1 Tax=Chelonus insularis TaxID=460826 RepID=UPI001588E918|nr:uncharacterized protein LOC118073650 [Chelonus insularis]